MNEKFLRRHFVFTQIISCVNEVLINQIRSVYFFFLIELDFCGLIHQTVFVFLQSIVQHVQGVLNLTDFPRSESLSKNGSSRYIFKETQVSLQMNYDNDFSFQVIYD